MTDQEPRSERTGRRDAPAPPRVAPSFAIPGFPPLGALTLGAFAVCVVSGIVLFTGFEPARPLASTLAFETGRPFGWFVRNLHAWSAQLALVALVAHTADHILRKADRNTPAFTWATLVAALPVTLYLMLGGRALPGDAEGNGVASVMYGIVSRAPWIGDSAAMLMVGGPGGDCHVLTVHHVTTATLALALLTVFHIRKLAPDPTATAAALGLSGLIALLARPALVAAAPDAKLFGPWYMGGLRLMLEYLPVWTAGLILPAAVLAAVSVLPLATPKGAAAMRIVLAVLLAAYAALTLAAVRG